MFLDIRETGVGETRVVSHETGLDITKLFFSPVGVVSFIVPWLMKSSVERVFRWPPSPAICALSGSRTRC